jgi:N-acetylglutamate synthase-like GNAT family acetyltransferase
MNDHSRIIRLANKGDLPQVNQIIEKAIKTWQLPERVKRLALPSYLYNELDLLHFYVFVVESNGSIVGVGAVDRDPVELEGSGSVMLLHGIYVDPDYQRAGIGSQLLKYAESSCREHRVDGLLVKVQKGAENFFQAMGLKRLAVKNSERDYENRYWKPIH